MRCGMGRRAWRGCLAGVIALVVTSGAQFPATAQADPNAVAAAQAKLDAMEAKSSALDADYSRAQADLDAATARLSHVTADLTGQTKRVTAMANTIGALALQAYQNSGSGITEQLLAGSDDSSFLNRLATVQTVTNRANVQLQDFQAQQAVLADLRAELNADRAQIAVSVAHKATLKRQLDAEETQAKQVLAELTAQEQARLLALQQQQEAAAAAAAAAANAALQANQGASSGPPTSTDTAAGGTSGGTASSRALQALAFAEAQVGKAYVYGATGPSAYDCSGLMMKAYASAGISLPRVASAQFQVGTPVAASDLLPGDLVFYYSGISHVGMYVGNGVIVNAENPRAGIRYAALYSMPFMGARRVG